MNPLSFPDLKDRLRHRGQLHLRVLDHRRLASTFSRGDEPDALRRIFVINLDRRPDRWRRVRRELDRFRERNGERLSVLTRRFSAADARYLDSAPDGAVLTPTFTLAEQLAVEPNPLVGMSGESYAREIEMTRQEIAVALSHIEVWRQIADGDVPSALVLEDDIFMIRGFASHLEAAWSRLNIDDASLPDFDLLYLSYEEVGGAVLSRSDAPIRRPQAGIWNASGYVLTREGARKLLDLLPAHGPIDLWLNLQFPHLRVFVTARSIIEQRADEPSTNSYSVLPVLSQVGVITREKPLLPTVARLRGPVVAVGCQASGLTALAKALSMLGYTGCSDLSEFPADELRRLRSGDRNALFNAYVNVGTLDSAALAAIATSNPAARFISTSDPTGCLASIDGGRVLHLPMDADDKWAKLSDFLGVEYPSLPYPDDEPDLGQRRLIRRQPSDDARRSATPLKSDRSPWVLRTRGMSWPGIPTEARLEANLEWSRAHWPEDDCVGVDWRLRDDTFPSNRALFMPSNFTEGSGGGARLVLREEKTSVREFTSAAIATRRSYLYGSFSAELRPPKVAGLITGVFLHRNAPRQEIDIEFLGKDTTMMLINVYYNPGPSGTRLEYGYRGTPAVVDLGFDAAEDFHTYEIDWQPNVIRWKVDGTVVCERVVWDPTPIPDQPLEMNVNLWHSRSVELAGRLARKSLPASVDLRAIMACGGIVRRTALSLR